MFHKIPAKIFSISMLFLLLLSACNSAAVPASGQVLDTASQTALAAGPVLEEVSPMNLPPAGGSSDQQKPSGNPPEGAPPQGTPPTLPGGAALQGTPPAPPQGAPPNGMPPDGNFPGGAPPEGGMPPDGAPPAGGPPPAGSPPGGNTADESALNYTAAYTLDGESASQTGQTYTASNTDQSAVYVLNNGNLTLNKAVINTTGNSSSSDKSSFYGLNSGVLAASGSIIDISDSTVTTTGDGANGVFATGEGASITLSDVKIDCTGQYAHAVMATRGGTLTLTDVDMTTAGASSGAIATDRGSGTIRVTGGTVITSGSNSPGIYSTGKVTVSNASISASGAESAVIEGANSITLNDTSLVSAKKDKWGVMIYQSFSGDAEGSDGVFTMTGGTLSYTSTSGPLFYVTNTTGTITLNHVDAAAASGVLLKAGAGNWGSQGSNGGTVIFTADEQTLNGDFYADKISSIALTLQNNTALNGAINPDNTAKKVSLTLDSTSSWSLTGDSYLTVLEDSAGISGTSIVNITGNGHTITYDSAANPALGGKVYTLNGGGYLKPAE